MIKFGQKGSYDNKLGDEASKSEIKRELLALKELGKELLKLPAKDLDKLDLSERLYEALIKAQSMVKGALNRQIGTIGGLIVQEEHQSIKLKMEQIKQTHNGQVKKFKQLEQWRDQLLAGDRDVMTVLRNQFDGFDLQHVRQLVRNANKESSQNKAPKSARLLFKYLQQCQLESR